MSRRRISRLSLKDRLDSLGGPPSSTPPPQSDRRMSGMTSSSSRSDDLPVPTVDLALNRIQGYLTEQVSCVSQVEGQVKALIWDHLDTLLGTLKRLNPLTLPSQEIRRFGDYPLRTVHVTSS